MATLVIMPRQGQSVESCVITSWSKKVGDKVSIGDVLFSYETDKSSFEEPAPEAGKILAIFREEGDDVPCLENVLVIGADGEQLGIMSTEQALRMAYNDGLDLVMMTGNSNPPVCKIMNFGKFRFEREKKEKEA